MTTAATEAGGYRSAGRPEAGSAIPVNIVLFDDHVPEVDADPEDDALVLCRISIAVGHRPLNLDRAADRVDYARKFDQHAVAGGRPLTTRSGCS
jgi:hypothetical protein